MWMLPKGPRNESKITFCCYTIFLARCLFLPFTYKPQQRNNLFLSTIPLWLMENLDFEILKLNFQNLKIFLGLRNESGPKWVGAQMSRGPNESGPKWVGAQMCWGPNESGPKCVGAQMSWGPNVLGTKWVRGPNEWGPNESGAQMRNGPKCVPAIWTTLGIYARAVAIEKLC